MQRSTSHSTFALILAFIGMLASGPVLADKPAWAGGDKSEKHGKGDKGGAGEGDQAIHDGNAMTVSIRFDDRQRTSIRNYYGEQIRSGHCPPGLAKKNNGCMPPGQAKKWAVGQQLPPDVVYVDLSPEIVVVLGPPPELHKYVRVASDILLIAVGTSMVVDAIEDLSNL